MALPIPPRAAGAAALVAVIVLALPAGAGAAELYVSKTGNDVGNTTCAQANPCLTVQKAVLNAPNESTIHIGPGSFDEAVSTIKEFNFVGAGAGTPAAFDPATDTRIRAPDGAPALRMERGGLVTKLRLEGGNGTTGDGAPGLDLRAASAAVERNYAVGNVIASGGAAGDDGDSTTSEAAGDALRAEDPGPSTVGVVMFDTLLEGPGFGAHLRNSGTVGFARVTFNVSSRAVNIFGPKLTIIDRSATAGMPNSGIVVVLAGEVRISRSSIVAKSPLLNNAGVAAAYDVRNSLLASVGNGQVQVTGPATFTARGSTISSRGPGVSQALSVVRGNVGQPASASVVNSIVRATDTDASPGDVDVKVDGKGEPGTSFTAKSSSFSDVSAVNAGTATAPASDSNVAGDPGFADEPGLDFRLVASSPLIDRGDPAAVSGGENDLDGNPRSLDGDGDCVAVPDIGAFERADICPAAPPPGGGPGPGPGPGTGPGADLIAPIFRRLTLARRVFRVGGPQARMAAAKKGTRFMMTLSEAARVTIAIERAGAGRRVGRRCVRPTLANLRRKRCTRYVRQGVVTRQMPAGPGAIPFSGKIGRRTLKPGKHRALVQAADARGNRSPVRTLTFRIVRR